MLDSFQDTIIMFCFLLFSQIEITKVIFALMSIFGINPDAERGEAGKSAE